MLQIIVQSRQQQVHNPQRRDEDYDDIELEFGVLQQGAEPQFEYANI